MAADGQVNRLDRGKYGHPDFGQGVRGVSEVVSDDKAQQERAKVSTSDTLDSTLQDGPPLDPLSEVSESPKAHKNPSNTCTSASDTTSDTRPARCPIPETPDKAPDLDIPPFLDRRNGRQPDWLKPRIGPPPISAGPDDDLADLDGRWR
jgi:hypothetical protein